MLFNSWNFLVFFFVVTLLYFSVTLRFKNILLLLASCFFYMSYIPQYILILFFLITLDYGLAILIESSDLRKKKLLLVPSLAANVLTLFGFKYFNFFTGSEILLPIGLSFHTMQSMSYVIEVSREKQKAERNYLTFALYIMFYPQLVAGPIERPQNLLKQFYEVHKVDIRRILNGLALMLLGFYKKVVIADYLSSLVNPVFKNPTQYTGTDFILAALTFSMQIYCDFSGYSDIARGAAKVMGFELSENFERPFHASNLIDLWKRWHITLTGWFRDYVYIPLGGSRKSRTIRFLNILLVFLLSGLWHGVGWNFILWAELNGLMIVVLYFLSSVKWWRANLNNKYLGIFLTYLYFSFTFIFFRVSNFEDGIYMVSRLFTGGSANVASLFNVSLTIALVFSLEILHYVQKNTVAVSEFIASKTRWQKWTLYYVLALFFIVLTYLSVAHHNVSEQPFIYFQF